MMKRNLADRTNKSTLHWAMLRNRTVVAVAAAVLAGLLACIVIHVRASGSHGPLTTTNDAKAEVRTKLVPPLTPRASRALQDDGPSVKLVTLSAGGFEPRELLSSQSRFILMIDNLTALDDVLVQLSRAGAGSAPGARIHEVGMPGGRINWTSTFELDPGEYVLTEATHPNWVCKLTVRN